MRLLRVVAVVLFAFVVDVAGQSAVSGRWSAIYAGPRESQPLTIAEVVLDLSADGTTLTGTAEIGSWPGLAPITDGWIEGPRISFTWTGRNPSSGGYPRAIFVGTIQGDSITLKMTQEGGSVVYFEGKRLTN
jgi:hypothetical protein